MIGLGSLLLTALVNAVVVASPTLASANYSQGDIEGGGQSIVLTGTNLSTVTLVTIVGTSVIERPSRSAL